MRAGKGALATFSRILRMKKILLAAAVAGGLFAAPLAASASVTVSTLGLAAIIMGSVVGGHILTHEAQSPHIDYGHVPSKWEIMRLQRDLRNKGCNPGPIDGIVGPRTRAAIERCYGY